LGCHEYNLRRTVPEVNGGYAFNWLIIFIYLLAFFFLKRSSHKRVEIENMPMLAQKKVLKRFLKLRKGKIMALNKPLMIEMVSLIRNLMA